MVAVLLGVTVTTKTLQQGRRCLVGVTFTGYIHMGIRAVCGSHRFRKHFWRGWRGRRFSPVEAFSPDTTGTAASQPAGPVICPILSNLWSSSRQNVISVHKTFNSYITELRRNQKCNMSASLFSLATVSLVNVAKSNIPKESAKPQALPYYVKHSMLNTVDKKTP